MAHHQALRGSQAPSREIPDKLYFRIGDVSRLCEVAPYVLRFWESEFPQLRPNKGGTGQRLYRKRDVETALRIKRLLYDEGYTIPGARQVFKAETKEKEPALLFRIEEPAPAPADLARLRQLRKELSDVAALLSTPASAESVPEEPSYPAIRTTAPVPFIAPVRRKTATTLSLIPKSFSGENEFLAD